MRIYDVVNGTRDVKVDTVKIWPEYFQAQKQGIKNFEIRRNDRDYQVGQIIVLKEFDPQKNEFTGRKIYCLITYITNYEQKEGYVVLGTKRI